LKDGLLEKSSKLADSVTLVEATIQHMQEKELKTIPPAGGKDSDRNVLGNFKKLTMSLSYVVVQAIHHVHGANHAEILIK
jgi:hypothetical protein